MVGRNDPCPCGSGRKYKKCCLNKNQFIEVKPLNRPELINYHIIGNGKKWVKRPGLLDIQLVISDSKNMDTPIENIFKEIFDYLQDTGHQKLKEKLHECKHKIYAVRHCKLSIEKEVRNKVEEFIKEYQANSGIQVEEENQKLIFDIESFLFQAKSNLDLLTQVLGLIFPVLKSFRTFKHCGEKDNFIAGGKVIGILKKNNKEFADLFEKNRKLWIQDMVIMRDIITHYSRLKNFHCFVEEPYLGKEKVKVHYPSMPTGERVDKYCERIYENLITLYKNIFHLIIQYNIKVKGDGCNF